MSLQRNLKNKEAVPTQRTAFLNLRSDESLYVTLLVRQAGRNSV